ncbi:MAG: cyclic GMP-AMP synthase DncV-like nucleotidyltransferase [Myxococcota bacterium]
MSLQDAFLRFHDTIRIDYDTNAGLRQKRERILKRLKGFPAPFRTFHQGSYILGTGVRPIAGEYDLDVGLAFQLDHEEFDPVEVKKWIFEIFHGHTRDVRIRRHCITVFYAPFERNPPFHVDFAVYAEDADQNLHLAVGKANSREDLREWRRIEARELVELLKNHLEGEERAQFRRVIRYLKRWKEVNFENTGKSAPTGIALSLAAMQFLEPSEDDDVGALRSVVEGALGDFRRSFAHGFARRLILPLPVEPGADVLERMSGAQMEAFERKLQQLADSLEAAARSGPTTRTRILRGLFGSDFK